MKVQSYGVVITETKSRVVSPNEGSKTNAVLSGVTHSSQG